MIKKFNEHNDEDELKFTLQDMIDAVQYGFDYHVNSQNDGKSVPVGNTLQWIMAQKKLLEIPKEFKRFKN